MTTSCLESDDVAVGGFCFSINFKEVRFAHMCCLLKIFRVAEFSQVAGGNSSAARQHHHHHQHHLWQQKQLLKSSKAVRWRWFFCACCRRQCCPLTNRKRIKWQNKVKIYFGYSKTGASHRNSVRVIVYRSRGGNYLFRGIRHTLSWPSSNFWCGITWRSWRLSRAQRLCSVPSDNKIIKCVFIGKAEL